MFKDCSFIVPYSSILNIVNEDTILSTYLGKITYNNAINSPLRKDDKPSFSFYYYKGYLRFKDFGTGQTGNLIEFLKLYFNLSYSQVIEKLYNTFIKGNKTNETLIHYNIKITTLPKINLSKEIKFHIRDFNQKDYDYWQSYGINKYFLENSNIYSIDYLILKNNSTIKLEDYSYLYLENKDNKISYKIYQPYNIKYKWRRNCDSSVWELWTKLPKYGDKLIITSSRKDALCIWCNCNIPSISMQSETTIPKDAIIKELKERFKHIFILYDNDFKNEINNGRIYGKKIAKLFNCKQIEIPIEYLSKDISDLYKNKGKEIVIQLINKLTNNEI
jgi:hypothetical protein